MGVDEELKQTNRVWGREKDIVLVNNKFNNLILITFYNFNFNFDIINILFKLIIKEKRI